MPMKSLLSLSYRAGMQGTDFTAEVLQWLITACRKIILSVLGGTAGATSMQGLQRGFPVPAQRRLSVPSTHSYKGCQFQPSKNSELLISDPQEGAVSSRVQKGFSTSYYQLSVIYGVKGRNCGLPVSSWSWTENIQLSSKSTTMALILTWVCGDRAPCAPMAEQSVHPHPLLPHSPAKCAWMGSLTEKLLWGLM